MIESLSAGMPMLCLPFLADQLTNSWWACSRMGVGIEIGENVKRDQVEKLDRELIGEKGVEMEEETCQSRRFFCDLG